MTHACAHHCYRLSLRSQREQSADCPADALLCRKYLDPLPPDTERDAITQALAMLFDVANILDKIDRVALTEATIKEDLARVEMLMQDALPEADWIHLDDIGLSHDWSGTRLALIFAVEHPYLQAAVGLVIGADDAKLTLGRSDRANADEFCRRIERVVKQPALLHQDSNRFLAPGTVKQSPPLAAHS